MDASPLPTIVAPVNVYFNNNNNMDNPPDYEIVDMIPSADDLPSYEAANDSLSPPPYDFDDAADVDVQVSHQAHTAPRVTYPARLARVPRTHNPFSRAYIPRQSSAPSPRQLEAGHGHMTTVVNSATVAVQVSAARVVGGRIMPGRRREGNGRRSRGKGCKLCLIVACLMVVGVVLGAVSLAAGFSGMKTEIGEGTE